MGKQNGKVNTALLAAAVLLCLTLFTTHLTSGLYARYTASAQSSDSARVARYSFDVKGGTASQEFTIDLDEINKPGTSASCSFLVTNADEDGVCEVAQQYTVYITELGSLPLSYDIRTSGGSNANAGENGSGADGPSITAAWDGSETAVVTDTMQAGVEESHAVTLDISWPEENAEPGYAGGVASLHIRIEAEQLD